MVQIRSNTFFTPMLTNWHGRCCFKRPQGTSIRFSLDL
jgi:hypothetical protein